MQIEGFALYLLSGAFVGSVIHYLVARFLGPLLFNRGWCGWGCWTARVLDLLPFRRPRRQAARRRWGYARYAHAALSVGLVLYLWLARGYRLEGHSRAELV